MNKRGESVGDQLMFVWFFLMLVLIVGGLAIGASIYFGKNYDARGEEATILFDKIRDCFVSNDLTAENFYDVCLLNESLLNENNIRIRICEEECASGKIFLQLGSDFESCYFVSDIEGKNEQFGKCFKGITKKNGKNYIIEVGSNQEAEDA